MDMKASGRGDLRIYLGAAPGVGKTLSMLDEGNRRRERGLDVVVAYVESHGRVQTEAAIGELEVLPRRSITHRGSTFEEMDVDAVLGRRPKLALVDEFAHTNVPGSRNAKRWQDVEELLAAGIDVISTLNIQHLASLTDLVERITGVAQRETVPDAMVRAADQIQLVDQTPEALRRRMAHGNIYAPDKVDAALSNYFRVGNLTALRELALLWVADRVEEGMQRYRVEHDIDKTWETRERVVVALTGGVEGATLIRRAARIADRASAELLAVHVAGGDGLTGVDAAALAGQRELVESLGGSYHMVRAPEVTSALLDFARGVNATQLVLGVSRRGPLLHWLTGPGTASGTVRASGDIDILLVSHEAAGRGKSRRSVPAYRRSAVGAVAAAVLLALTVASMTSLRGQLSAVSQVLVFLLATVVVALIGGRVVAVLTALVASILLNYYFIEPLHRFTISDRNNAFGLLVFLIVAAVVAVLVDRAERRRREAARATAEAETLATVAGSVLRGRAQLPALLEQLREIFNVDSVALLQRDPQRAGWIVVAAAGHDPAQRPEQADAVAPGDDDTVLVMRGAIPAADDQRVLTAFAIQATAAMRTARLSEAAAAGSVLQEVDRTRTALLRAVGHDLRTPLAAAKAAVSSLRMDRQYNRDVAARADVVVLDEADRAELLATADESLDRLGRLVEDLLDMSRLEAGATAVVLRPVALDAVVAAALDAIGAARSGVRLDIPLDLPEVSADPALLARVVANLTDNALRYSPPGWPPTVTASVLGDRAELRVIDRGPGLPRSAREQVFAPFQRLADSNSTGVGLGLALARGFSEGMGATLEPEETPGGGLSMVLSMPLAGPADRRADLSAERSGADAG